MLGDTENRFLSSTTSQQNETVLMSSSGGRVMDKPSQHQPLKCPRCDSSYTKFCYFNNYSLSQPRHFCKACKRYWTQGGTLRNVPVGGGYRRNKRIKRPTPSCTDIATSLAAPTPTPHHMDVSAINYGNLSSYGLPDDPSYTDLQFSGFNSRTSNVSCIGYDHQLQLSALGLSFPMLTMSSDAHDDNRDVITPSNSLPSNFSLLGSPFPSSSYATTTSLLSTRLQHQKLSFGDSKEARPVNHFQALLPFEGFRMVGNGEREMVTKEVKFEEGNNGIGNKMEWSFPCQNQIEQIGSSDPSFYWNQTSIGAWPNPSNS